MSRRDNAAPVDDLPMDAQPTPARPQPVKQPTRALRLGDYYQTATEIEEGEAAVLELRQGGEVVGELPIRIAYGKTTKYLKTLSWATRAVKWGRKANGQPRKPQPVALSELDMGQQTEAVLLTLARVNWLSFEGEIEMPSGEVLTDSVESRETILRTFPEIHKQIVSLTRLDENEDEDSAEADLGES